MTDAKGSIRLDTALGRLRLISLFEGASFILLLAVAMPLKYMAGDPRWVRWIGSAHGGLFLLYLLALLQAWDERSWKLPKVLGLFVASVLPFGPFVAERNLKREAMAASSEAAPS